MSITCYDSNNQELKTLYQWDNNQKITIKGFESTTKPAFHFCNRSSQVALVVGGLPESAYTKSNGKYITGTVTIPNELLQKSEPITIYLYHAIGTDGTRTLSAISIPVMPRPKPDDYTFVETVNYLSLAVLDSRLSTLLSQSMADGEVVDIRTGADGTAYTLAGDAVRATQGVLRQFNGIIDFELGSFGPATGSGAAHETLYRNKLDWHPRIRNKTPIPLENLYSLTLPAPQDDSIPPYKTYLMFYDKDMNYISVTALRTFYKMDLVFSSGNPLKPENAYYMNLSISRMKGTSGTDLSKSDDDVYFTEEDVQEIHDGVTVITRMDHADERLDEINSNALMASGSYFQDVPGDADMDDYKEPGNCFILWPNNPSRNRDVKNLPNTLGGRLFVMQQSNSNTRIQMYFDFDGNIWSRGYVYDDYVSESNGAHWTTWRAMHKAVTIPAFDSETNKPSLNDYTSPGAYKVRSDTEAAKLYNADSAIEDSHQRNIPIARAGQLVVIDTGGGTDLSPGARTQIYYDTTADVWIRRCYNATSGLTWSPWAKVQKELTFDEIPTAGSNNPVKSKGIKAALDSMALGNDTLTATGAQATSLQRGDDLNTYVTPGNYKILEPAYISNCPDVWGGRLFIIQPGNTERIYQIFLSVSGNIWTRIHKVREK